MRTLTHSKTITLVILAASLAGLGLGCKRSAENRAADATTLIRAMGKDMLEAQKQEIAKFKALPNADAIRLDLDKNLDGWSVSEKNLSQKEDNLEKILINFQKEAKEEALIGDLHLYAKKMAKESQEQGPEYQGRLDKTKKQLDTGQVILDNGTGVPMPENIKKLYGEISQIIPLEIELRKADQKIAEGYTAKLEKLMN